jgi:hypothetical protein
MMYQVLKPKIRAYIEAQKACLGIEMMLIILEYDIARVRKLE